MKYHPGSLLLNQGLEENNYTSFVQSFVWIDWFRVFNNEFDEVPHISDLYSWIN